MKKKHDISKLNLRTDISTDEIIKLYFENKLGSYDIAKKLNCSYALVQRRIKKAGYKLRSASEAHKLKPARYWLGKKIPAEQMKRKVETCRIRNLIDPDGRNKKPSESYMGEKNHFFGKKHTDEAKVLIRKARALQITPKQDTSIEVKIHKFLTELKIEFYTHHYISSIDHAYRCDIFIPSNRSIIECDGDYFHANPVFYKKEELTEKQLKQRYFDDNRTKQLIEQGYTVIRLWENKIKKMSLDDFKVILNKVPQQEAGA